MFESVSIDDSTLSGPPPKRKSLLRLIPCIDKKRTQRRRKSQPPKPRIVSSMSSDPVSVSSESEAGCFRKLLAVPRKDKPVWQEVVEENVQAEPSESTCSTCGFGTAACTCKEYKTIQERQKDCLAAIVDGFTLQASQIQELKEIIGDLFKHVEECKQEQKQK